jgi:hypothetical protein
MIIRTKNGELLEINKYDFSNDMIYYEKIMNIKKEFTKDDKYDKYDKYEKYENKHINFFSPKKIDKRISSSLQSISDFINIKL